MSTERNLLRKFINETKTLNEKSVLGVKLIEDPKILNPFGRKENPAPKKGFYKGITSTYFNVPAGKIEPDKLYYCTGISTDPIYVFDGDVFKVGLKPTANYMLKDTKKYLDIFIKSTERITEKEAEALMAQSKNAITGTKSEILKYLETQDENTKFIIRKV